MLQKYSVAIAAIMMIASGVVQGIMSERWGTSADVETAAETLKSFPTTIGVWDSSEFELSANMLKTAEVAGCLSRRYVNRVDGNTITLLIFCGRPGPISLHPPTACFPSAGLSLEAPPTRCRVSADGIVAELWQGDFVKQTGGIPVRLRTFWTWHGKDAWQIPANPRVTFAREPYIFKMYITRVLEGPGPRPAEDPCQDFIRLVITELQNVLPPPAA